MIILKYIWILFGIGISIAGILLFSIKIVNKLYFDKYWRQEHSHIYALLMMMSLILTLFSILIIIVEKIVKYL